MCEIPHELVGRFKPNMGGYNIWGIGFDDLAIGPVKKKKNIGKIALIFLSISLNMCFGSSNEPSHRDGCFEDPHHIFS